MQTCRRPLSLVLFASALALSLSVPCAQAASFLQGSAGFDGRPLLHQAVDRGSAQLVLASASESDSKGGAKGEGKESATAEPGNEDTGPAAEKAAATDEPAGASAEAGRKERAEAAQRAADEAEASGDGNAATAGPAGDIVAGERRSAAATEAAAAGSATQASATKSEEAAAGDDPGAAATNGADSAALAESSAEASLSTASGLDAQAGAAATAEVTEDGSGATAQSDATAGASVAVESEQSFTTKNKSKSKSIATKYGAITIARTTTQVVLEDGTRVRANSFAMARALATPGVTKTDTKTRADVRAQDAGRAAERSGSEVEGTQTSSTWVDSAAISEANAQ